MNPVYIIIGALIGGFLGKWGGMVGGALIGYLLGALGEMGERLAELEKDIARLRNAPLKQALADAGLMAGDINEVVMVGGMTRMPAIQDKVRQFFGKEPHKGVNPDEVVAVGAAIQAGVLGGEVKDILLLDVTPLTLSIETMGAVATPQIERNTTIPTRRSQVFSTASDNQTQVEIHVLQGERPMAMDNKSLGRFILDGIPPAPRGLPQIEVTFDIDANGILKVTAKDKATGRMQHITITASSGLSKDEVERMTKEAEKNAAEDKKRKEEVETRNTADAAVFTAEKALRDGGDKVPADVKSAVENKIEGVKKALEGKNQEAIKTATNDLYQEVQKIGSAMYGGQAGPGMGGQGGPGGPGGPEGGSPGGGDGKGGDDVVEGEFKEA